LSLQRCPREACARWLTGRGFEHLEPGEVAQPPVSGDPQGLEDVIVGVETGKAQEIGVVGDGALLVDLDVLEALEVRYGSSR
jgi:hypothetical protein